MSATGLDSGSVSAVISLDALYLAPDLAEALAEVCRISSPGAPLIFTFYIEESSHQVEQPDWERLLQSAGFLIVERRTLTEEWRLHMRCKHQRRWDSRAIIRRYLGHLAEAELSVSASMLGLDGRPAFVDRVSRFELHATRR